MDWILLTTSMNLPETYGYDDAVVDVMANRLTKNQGIFTFAGHFHFPPLHTIAQNLATPSVVLEGPRADDFLRELDRGPAVVGISCNVVNLEAIQEMCHLVRHRAPRARLVLGGCGAGTLAEVKGGHLADHICRGEGIGYLRSLLGEPADGPFGEALPTCQARMDFLPTGFYQGSLTSGLGCEEGCEFCATAHFFGGFLPVATPAQIHAGLQALWRRRPDMDIVSLWDEDFFSRPERVRALSQLMSQGRDLERLNYFTFASNRSLGQMSDEEILRSGASMVWVGVESMFSPLDKRQGPSLKDTFERLHNLGVQTTGSFMVGFDFQNRANLDQDIEGYVSLSPTFAQISRVLPLPGTPLWQRLLEEGRLDLARPWSEAHFYGGALLHPDFLPHELELAVERAYTRLNDHAGPTVARIFDVHLRGLEHCRRSGDAVVREHRSLFHLDRLERYYPILLSLIELGPSGRARRLAREMRRRYHRLVGPPASWQVALSRLTLAMAQATLALRQVQPRLPTPFVPKRYIYDGDYGGARAVREGGVPYRVDHLSHSAPNRLARGAREAVDGLRRVVGWTGRGK